MILASMALLAGAGPVRDAVRLFAAGPYTCVERASGEQACWGGVHDRATPVQAIGHPEPVRRRYDEVCYGLGDRLVCTHRTWTLPHPVVETTGGCVLTTGQTVYCVHQRTRRPVEIPELRGARAVFADRCAVVGEEVRCVWIPGGDLTTLELPAVRDAVGRRYVVTRDDRLYQIQPLQLVQGSPGLVELDEEHVGVGRLATGEVVGARGEPWPFEVPLLERRPPPRLGRPTTVLQREHHGCAIVRTGEVVCWGADWANQLGDGDGPRLTWSGPERRRPPETEEDRLACTLDHGTVTCAPPAPFDTPTVAPLALTGVDALERSRAVACAWRGRSVACFGVVDGLWVEPDVAVLDEVIGLAVGPRVAALTGKGDVHVIAYPEPSFLWAFELPRAERIVVGDWICAQAGAAVRCTDGATVIEADPAESPIEAWGPHVCQSGSGRCLDGPYPRRLTADRTLHRVEAGW